MKFPLLLLSHLALGLAGWAITREFRSASAPEQAKNSRARSTHPRPLQNPRNEMVRAIEARLEKDKAAKAKLEAESDARVKILAALPGLVLPEDPAPAIVKLIAADDENASIQAAALFVLWTKTDPAACCRGTRTRASDRSRRPRSISGTAGFSTRCWG